MTTTMIEEEISVDFRTLAQEYVKEYLVKSKVGQWPGCGFGDEYEDAIAQCERWITKKHVPPEGMISAIKNDPRLADLLEEDEKPETCPDLPEDIQVPENFQFENSDAYKLTQTYVKFSKEASPEGYEDFHSACFLWLLSAIAARRLFIYNGRIKTYTNLRIALCAGSTDFAKSMTANVATSVLREELGLGHLLIRTSEVTPEKLISNMVGNKINVDDWIAMDDDQKKLYNIRMAWAAQKSMYWDEFGHTIKNMSKEHSSTAGFVSLLLQLEDCHLPIGKDTIARKEESIEKPYLPILASMVPVNLKNIAKAGSDFWGDGSGARANYTCAEINEYIDACAELKHIPAPGPLVQALHKWHTSLGSPRVEVKIKESDESNGKSKPQIRETIEVIIIDDLPEYQCKIDSKANDQYKAYRSALKKISHSENFPTDLKPNYGRLPTTHLRVAMLFASLENRNGDPKEIVITLTHILIAQHFVEMFRRGLHRFYEQATGFKTIQSKTESEIVTLLRTVASKAKTEARAWLSVAQIRSRLNEKYGTDEIKKILRPLEGTVVDYQVGKRSDSRGSYRIKK